MRSETPTLSAPKLLGLEVLRFVAAFSVLIWHYQHFAYVADQPVDLVRSRLPFYSVLQAFYEAGQYGVWVFWCISGFIFFWKYRDAIHDRSTSGWTFFVFRVSRLYPLHVATLLIVALLQFFYFGLHGFYFVYQQNDVGHFVLQSLLASAWGVEQGDSFNGPIWSISVEVLVYIFFFLALRYVTRSALLNVVVIILCFNLRGQVFSCLAFFYAGGLAAMYRRGIETTAYRMAIERFAWVIALVVALSAWYFRSSGSVVDWPLLLILTPVLLFCLSSDISLPAPIEKVVVAAGSMTYSSYLLHFPFQLLLALGFSLLQKPIPFNEIWFFLLFVVTTLVASLLTYRHFEMPAQRMLRSFLLRRQRSTSCDTLIAAGGHRSA